MPEQQVPLEKRTTQEHLARSLASVQRGVHNIVAAALAVPEGFFCWADNMERESYRRGYEAKRGDIVYPFGSAFPVREQDVLGNGGTVIEKQYSPIVVRSSHSLWDYIRGAYQEYLREK